MKKRTTAQRRAAAKEGWKKRRLAAAHKPTSTGGMPTAGDVWAVPRGLKDLGAEMGMKPIIAERGNGNPKDSFGLSAEVSQRLKAVFEWALEQGADPTAAQKEATDIICTTFGKIYSSDPNIGGYWGEIAYRANQVMEHMKS